MHTYAIIHPICSSGRAMTHCVRNVPGLANPGISISCRHAACCTISPTCSPHPVPRMEPATSCNPHAACHMQLACSLLHHQVARSLQLQHCACSMPPARWTTRCLGYSPRARWSKSVLLVRFLLTGSLTPTAALSLTTLCTCTRRVLQTIAQCRGSLGPLRGAELYRA